MEWSRVHAPRPSSSTSGGQSGGSSEAVEAEGGVVLAIAVEEPSLDALILVKARKSALEVHERHLECYVSSRGHEYGIREKDYGLPSSPSTTPFGYFGAAASLSCWSGFCDRFSLLLTALAKNLSILWKQHVRHKTTDFPVVFSGRLTSSSSSNLHMGRSTDTSTPYHCSKPRAEADHIVLMTVYTRTPCAIQAILAATSVLVNNHTLLVEVQDSMSKGGTTRYTQDTHTTVNY